MTSPMTQEERDGLRDMPDAMKADGGPGPLSQLVNDEWQSLMDKDDRTSPAEYPDMVLLTQAELGGAMSEAYLLGREAGLKAAPLPTPNVAELIEALEEAKADRKAHADHVLHVAAEARDGFDALEMIDKCWEQFGIPNNRAHLSLDEQIAAVLRERDDALDALSRAKGQEAGS